MYPRDTSPNPSYENVVENENENAVENENENVVENENAVENEYENVVENENEVENENVVENENENTVENENESAVETGNVVEMEIVPELPPQIEQPGARRTRQPPDRLTYYGPGQVDTATVFYMTAITPLNLLRLRGHLPGCLQ